MNLGFRAYGFGIHVIGFRALALENSFGIGVVNLGFSV